MFKNFSNFVLLAVYPSMVIQYEQFMLFISDLAGTKRNIFQQLSKLIELKFISTTWPN